MFNDHNNRMIFSISERVYLFILKDELNQKYFSLRRYDSAPQQPVTKDVSADKQIDLPMERWKQLSRCAEAATRAVSEMRKDYFPVGGGVYLTVDEPFVNIRLYRYKYDTKEVVPTKVGVGLNGYQWRQLQKVMDTMDKYVPELMSVRPCCWTHDNQMSSLECGECHPFGYERYQTTPVGFGIPAQPRQTGESFDMPDIILV